MASESFQITYASNGICAALQGLTVFSDDEAAWETQLEQNSRRFEKKTEIHSLMFKRNPTLWKEQSTTNV